MGLEYVSAETVLVIRGLGKKLLVSAHPWFRSERPGWDLSQVEMLGLDACLKHV